MVVGVRHQWAGDGSDIRRLMMVGVRHQWAGDGSDIRQLMMVGRCRLGSEAVGEETADGYDQRVRLYPYHITGSSRALITQRRKQVAPHQMSVYRPTAGIRN